MSILDPFGRIRFQDEDGGFGFIFILIREHYIGTVLLDITDMQTYLSYFIKTRNGPYINGNGKIYGFFFNVRIEIYTKDRPVTR